jgi:hypothetical protein
MFVNEKKKEKNVEIKKKEKTRPGELRPLDKIKTKALDEINLNL